MYEDEVVLADRYRVRRTLATGGMSVVYRATDTRLMRPVAIKTVQCREPQLMTRARREGRLLARLSHPNIVRLYDVFEHGGRPHLVTELVEGPTLRAMRGRLGEHQIATIAGQVAGALGATHDSGIVHRDVKPSNILLGDRVRLIDFGIADTPEDPAPALTDDATLGTAPYLSPEQLWGQRPTAASDVYALGLVLLECFSGRPAFGGPLAEAIARRVHRPPDIPESLPTGWRPLVAAMVDLDPGRRPTAPLVAETLRGLRLQASTAPAARPPAHAAPDRSRRATLDRRARRRTRRPRTAALPAAAAG
jgi:serine/threonine protein kinase